MGVSGPIVQIFLGVFCIDYIISYHIITVMMIHPLHSVIIIFSFVLKGAIYYWIAYEYVVYRIMNEVLTVVTQH